MSTVIHMAAGEEPGEPEIFCSIQGEGITAGERRIFLRLSGCNLACSWCDTAYTWNWQGTPFRHERDRPDTPHKFSRRKEVIKTTTDEVARKALAYSAPGFVITGGEPLLQRLAVADLIRKLRAARPDAFVEIETNGTIDPGSTLWPLVDQFNVSPKLAHSGMPASKALKPSVLRAFNTFQNAWFKFVARNGADITAIEALAARLGLDRKRLLVMPEGTDSKLLQARLDQLRPICQARGLILSDRLHIHAFGNRRGI